MSEEIDKLKKQVLTVRAVAKVTHERLAREIAELRETARKMIKDAIKYETTIASHAAEMDELKRRVREVING